MTLLVLFYQGLQEGIQSQCRSLITLFLATKWYKWLIPQPCKAKAKTMLYAHLLGHVCPYTFMHCLILTFPSLSTLFPPHSSPFQRLANPSHFFLQQHHLLRPPQKSCASLGPFNADRCQQTNQFQHTDLRKEKLHLHVALCRYHPRSHLLSSKSMRWSSYLVQDPIC